MSRSLPSRGEYDFALADPSRAFKSNTLKSAKFLPNPHFPHSFIHASGNFTVVARALINSENWAVRLFIRDAGELIKHYRNLPSVLRLFEKYSLSVQVFADEVAVDDGASMRYPVVLTEWFDGVTLANFVYGACEKRDAATLRALRAQTRLLSAALHRANLSHGDISPENLLVGRSQSGAIILKLIDYDSMWTPDEPFRSRPSPVGRNELQHPQLPNPIGPNADKVAFMLLDLALGLLSSDPTLGLDDSLFDGRRFVFQAGEILRSSHPLVHRIPPKEHDTLYALQNYLRGDPNTPPTLWWGVNDNGISPRSKPTKSKSSGDRVTLAEFAHSLDVRESVVQSALAMLRIDVVHATINQNVADQVRELIASWKREHTFPALIEQAGQRDTTTFPLLGRLGFGLSELEKGAITPGEFEQVVAHYALAKSLGVRQQDRYVKSPGSRARLPMWRRRQFKVEVLLIVSIVALGISIQLHFPWRDLGTRIQDLVTGPTSSNTWSVGQSRGVLGGTTPIPETIIRSAWWTSRGSLMVTLAEATSQPGSTYGFHYRQPPDPQWVPALAIARVNGVTFELLEPDASLPIELRVVTADGFSNPRTSEVLLLKGNSGPTPTTSATTIISATSIPPETSTSVATTTIQALTTTTSTTTSTTTVSLPKLEIYPPTLVGLDGDHVTSVVVRYFTPRFSKVEFRETVSHYNLYCDNDEVYMIPHQTRWTSMSHVLRIPASNINRCQMTAVYKNGLESNRTIQIPIFPYNRATSTTSSATSIPSTTTTDVATTTIAPPSTTTSTTTTTIRPTTTLPASICCRPTLLDLYGGYKTAVIVTFRTNLVLGSTRSEATHFHLYCNGSSTPYVIPLEQPDHRYRLNVPSASVSWCVMTAVAADGRESMPSLRVNIWPPN